MSVALPVTTPPRTTITRGELAALVLAGLRALRRGGWRLASVYLLSQVVIAAVVSPLVRWLFTEALEGVGVHGLDSAGLARVFAAPASLGRIVLLIFIVFVVMALQLFLILLAVRRVQRGLPLTARGMGAELRDAAGRLWQPGSLALLPYLFLLVPLGGFGFLSIITKAIAIPPFVTGELLKSVPGIIGLIVFVVVLSELLGRFSLALPLFATTRLTGARALSLSWRLTRRTAWSIVLAVSIVLAAALVGGFGILLVGIAPTALTDAVWPEASPMTAAAGLVIAQVLGIVVMGMAAVMCAAILLEALDRRAALLPRDIASGEVPMLDMSERAGVPPRRRRDAVLPVVVMAVTSLALSVQAIPVLAQLSQEPHTLVLGHRGFSEGGVENTISGLEAAHAVGADLVEMDVMQTSDGGFVVNHDANLSRLADRDVALADLTLAEATAIEVHDLAGHRDLIPSLADYVRHAEEIGQKLLIEIKLHGGETDDVVPRLVDELEELGVLEDHIYHSLSAPVVEELTRLRPGLMVGLTMAFAGTEAPQTSADFIVVEQWSYNPDLVADARRAGLGVFTWTVNDEVSLREMLRDDLDGIITDHPDVAVRDRDAMVSEQGLSGVLYDAIFRFVTIL